MSNEYERWKWLCDEQQAARDAIKEALNPVNQRFSDIADGRSKVNPSDDEIDRLEKAWGKWDDVKQKMKEFI